MTGEATPGVATLGRQAAGEGMSGRGWGWSKTSDVAAVPGRWRLTAWVDWTRIAGSRRSQGGALLVARSDAGVAVAALAPERCVVVAPLGTNLAGALSLRGHTVWDDPQIDLGEVEDSVGADPSATDEIRRHLGGLLQLLWKPARGTSVAVVDVGPGSRWIAALRVVADLVGVSSVAVGAGQVLDDLESAPQLQLVEPDVATLWSQDTGHYPLLREDSFDPDQVPAVAKALAGALVLAGGARSFADAVRSTSDWDGSWDGLRAWVDDRLATWGALPVLPAGAQPTDSLVVLAATAQGRAWLMEDALQDRIAWQGRSDPARSLARLAEDDLAAHTALQQLVLQTWDRAPDARTRFRLLSVLGPGLLDPAAVRSRAASVASALPDDELPDLLRWARAQKVAVAGIDERVAGLLSHLDEAEARELFALLDDPTALAAAAVGAPWLEWWVAAVDGAFDALVNVPGGPARIVRLAVETDLVTPLRAETIQERVRDDRVRGLIARGCVAVPVAGRDDVVRVVERAVVPLLGARAAPWYLDWLAEDGKVDLATLDAAGRTLDPSWIPPAERVVADLAAAGSDRERVHQLLDLKPDLPALIDAAKGKGAWVRVWLERPGTVTVLLDDPAGRAYLTTIDAWTREAERHEAISALEQPTRQNRWVEAVKAVVRSRTRPAEQRSDIDRLARPVLDEMRVAELIDLHLTELRGGLGEAEVLELLGWIGGPRPGRRPWERLGSLARERTAMSRDLAQAYTAVGVDPRDVVAGLNPVPVPWLWDLPDDDPLVGALIARMRQGYPRLRPGDLPGRRLPPGPRAREAVIDLLMGSDVTSDEWVTLLAPGEAGSRLRATLFKERDQHIRQLEVELSERERRLSVESTARAELETTSASARKDNAQLLGELAAHRAELARTRDDLAFARAERDETAALLDEAIHARHDAEAEARRWAEPATGRHVALDARPPTTDHPPADAPSVDGAAFDAPSVDAPHAPDEEAERREDLRNELDAERTVTFAPGPPPEETPPTVGPATDSGSAPTGPSGRDRSPSVGRRRRVVAGAAAALAGLVAAVFLRGPSTAVAGVSAVLALGVAVAGVDWLLQIRRVAPTLHDRSPDAVPPVPPVPSTAAPLLTAVSTAAVVAVALVAAGWIGLPVALRAGLAVSSVVLLLVVRSRTPRSVARPGWAPPPQGSDTTPRTWSVTGSPFGVRIVRGVVVVAVAALALAELSRSGDGVDAVAGPPSTTTSTTSTSPTTTASLPQSLVRAEPTVVSLPVPGPGVPITEDTLRQQPELVTALEQDVVLVLVFAPGANGGAGVDLANQAITALRVELLPAAVPARAYWVADPGAAIRIELYTQA